MNVLVCLKHAVDPLTAEYDVRNEQLCEPDHILAPVDSVALEQALALADAHGATVTAATVGPPRADAVLRHALTYGATAALRAWGESVEAADSFVVARVLAAVAKRIRADLVLLGTRSLDGASGCVGPVLAEQLELAYVSNVVSLALDAGSLTAVRAGDGGRRDEFVATLPAVLGVDVGLNTPRYVGVLSRTYRRGLAAAVELVSPADLGIPDGELEPALETVAVGAPRPRTKTGVKVSGMSMRDKLALMRGQSGKKSAELFSGPPADAAQIVLEKLSEWL